MFYWIKTNFLLVSALLKPEGARESVVIWDVAYTLYFLQLKTHFKILPKSIL